MYALVTPFWHDQLHPMELADQEILVVKSRFRCRSFTWFKLHTAVRRIHNGEAIFTDVAVCQCDNVRHAVLRKLFSIAEINAF